MATSAGGRKRIVCEACDLPYYADSGECPYCTAAANEASRSPAANRGDDTSGRDEDAGFVFGTGSPDRSRTTCRTCGLQHYADLERCPYCEYAGAGASTDAATDATDDATPDTAVDEAADSAEPSVGAEGVGLFGRLRRALGL